MHNGQFCGFAGSRRPKQEDAEFNLGNGFTRLHCHRNRIACCSLPVEKLGGKKQRLRDVARGGDGRLDLL